MTWFEDDAFWTTFHPILYSPERLAATPGEVDGFLQRADIDTGATVLDLACGPGRHSLELARRGYAVTAVDRTAAYLEHLDKAATAERLTIDIVRRDMRDFRRPGTYDAVFNTFTSFGYFEDPSDDAKVVRNVYDSLRPNGRFVVDVVGKETMARGWQERYWTWLSDELLLLEERTVQRDWTWVHNTWQLIHTQHRKSHAFMKQTYTLKHRLYSGTELRRLLLEAGFGDVQLYGSLDGSPYDRHAHRLVAVAHR